MPERPVRIGAGSWLGHGTVVLPGADIGRHVVIGANSVVHGRDPGPLRGRRQPGAGGQAPADVERPDPAADGSRQFVRSSGGAHDGM